VLRAALAQLPGKLEASAPPVASRPLGPSSRRYANGAAIIATRLDPEDLLDRLQAIEQEFGRKSGGQRWAARVLDLDIVLWNGGSWSAPSLTIPHPAFRERPFVMQPACTIAAQWRDPVTQLTLCQLKHRLTKPKALPR
jgi:2-amino-4-hydroxy-6-hydroxymethyldihydropteridine diphosphokinase